MTRGENAQAAWRIARLPATLCVMLSGSGRTLAGLLEAIERGRLDARIALVVASRECAGADRARTVGIPTLVLTGEIPAEQLARVLDERGIDVVALCGYLRRVHMAPHWRGRIVNIHPSLLPKFGGAGMYGDRVHAAVLGAGEKESGCTVHVVGDEYDQGPILLQRRCPVLPGDDVRTLAARVFEQEQAAYPEALQQFVHRHVHQHGA